MQEKTDMKQVVEISTAMNVVKLEKPCCPAHFRPRAVFRLLVNMHATSQPGLNLADDYRTSSPTASIIHPISEERHQRKYCVNTQEHGSRETQKTMDVIQTQSKRMEIGDEESKSPFHQSILRRAIRIFLTLFIILGVIVLFMIASQYVYLEAKRSWDLDKCTNGFVKLRYAGMYNPPV